MIHVLNKDYLLQCDIPFNILTDDELHRVLDNGGATYDFTMPSNHEDADLIVNEGYVVIPAPLPDIGFLEFIIKEADTKDALKTVNTELSAVTDLNKDYIRPVTFTDKTAKEMSASILSGTGWEPGFIESTGVKTLSINDYPTKMSGVQTIKDTFGLEVKFRVEWDGNKVIGRYVDMFDQIGNDIGKEFEYARDLQGLKLTSSSYETYGGVIGLGATDENGNYLTFKDVSRSVAAGDKFDKPAGQDYIIHPTASEDYSAIGKYVNTDITDPEELADKSWEWLLDQISIKETYNADVALLASLIGYEHEAVSMGDTIGIKNRKFNPPLMLRARIFDLTQSFVNPQNDKAILGDYRRVMASPNALIKQLQSKLHYTTGVASGASTAAKTAQQAADDAQTAAENAQNDADDANALLADIASDSKLTPSEKQTTKQEWDIIVAEKTTIDGQADTYSITTEKTNYDNAYTTLSDYITPLLADLTVTSDIVGTDFRAKFKAYYDTRTTLLRKVTDAAKQAVEDVQVGGRNLLLDSDVDYSNTTYPTHVYTMSEDMISGQIYTIRLKGMLGAGKTKFGVYLNGGSIFLDYLTDNGDGTYSITFAGKSDTSQEPNRIYIYPLSSAVVATSTIEWIKLEKGNKATDWTPAPEDVQAGIDAAQQVADNAQSTADGKNALFRQSTQPSTTGRKVGDLWFDTGNGNRMSVWTGSAWTLTKLDYQALSVGKISAISADLGNMTAGDIKGVTLNVGNGKLIVDANGNVTFAGNLDGASGSFDGDLTSKQIFLGAEDILGEGSLNFRLYEDDNNDGIANLLGYLGIVTNHPNDPAAPVMLTIGMRDFHDDGSGPIIDPTYHDIDELDLYTKLLTLTGNLKISGSITKTGQAWTNMALQNGCTNVYTTTAQARYMLNAMGEVKLNGRVKFSSTPADGVIIANLPAECRPLEQVYAPGRNAVIYIDTNGDVRLYSITKITDIGLDNFRYDVVNH